MPRMNTDKHRSKVLSVFMCVYLWLNAFSLPAAEHQGQVKFGGLPVPGASVTAVRGDKKLVAITDPQGVYSFPDLADGAWTMQVEMPGFAGIKQEVNIAADGPIPDWELKMLPLGDMGAETKVETPRVAVAAIPAPASAKPNAKGKTPMPPTNTPSAFQRADVNAAASNQASTPPAGEEAPPPSDAFVSAGAADLNQRASDGFLINGTANNGASSPFGLNQAFGNNRR